MKQPKVNQEEGTHLVPKKPLYEYAEEKLFNDYVDPFLDFCKREYHLDREDPVTKESFLMMKNRFSA